MITLIEILNEPSVLKETNTVAFRGPFIGVLSYSRVDNPHKLINFYRRSEDKWIANDMFMADQAEVVNESPLSFRLKRGHSGGCALYEGSPDYIRAEKKLRLFGLY